MSLWDLIFRCFGSLNGAFLDEFRGHIRKGPTCVWIERARSDCMLGLSDLAPKSMKKWMRSVTYSRRCFLRDFSFKSEDNGLPKVAQSGPRGAHGAPMASQGHPKTSTLAVFGREVVQERLQGTIWEALGSLVQGLGTHFMRFWRPCSGCFN